VGSGATGEAGAVTEAGKPGAATAGGGAQTPAAPAQADTGGGGGTVAVESGGEVQGGSEEEGASELEDRMARADPERAVADEADPEDVARGEAGEVEEEPDLSEITEPTAADAEALTDSTASQAPAETTTQADAGVETQTQIEEGTTAEPAEAAPTREDPVSAEGFSGDEPALGGAALEDGESSPQLSQSEQQAAMESLGESAGGSEGGGEGGGGGGGGGGAAVPEKSAPEAPDVSAEEPAAALAMVGGLPPVQLKQALTGVNAAVGRSAGEQRAELAANPPGMERPTGSPRNLHGKAPAPAASAGQSAKKLEQTAEGRDKPTPQPDALPEPPPSPAESISEPNVSGDEGGKLSESDVSRMSGSIAGLPTRDPGLHVSAGPAPNVELSGNADPAQTDQQQAELQARSAETQAQGRRDVAQEMGENTTIFPSVPPEHISAQVPQGGGPGPGGAAAAGAAGGANPEALSIIAQKEKGGEIQAALASAQGDMAAKKAEYGTRVGEEKASSAAEISALEAQSTADQARARSEAQREVRAKKGEWSQEQQQTVREADKEANSEIAKGRKAIQQKKQAADKEAVEHIQKGNKEAEAERRKAERKAAAEKRKGKKKSKGFFGWLASKAKAFFNAIKRAVKAAFDLARKLIKKAIEAARKAAMWVIEKARKAIVAAIKLVGKALIAIGDRLLAAFPKLRDKFRKFIQKRVDAAVNKVNELADKLKRGVAALLDALAAGLDKLIGWLEKGMLAAIDACAAVVDGAIKFAEKVAQVLCTFVVLVKDIAAGPVQWLSNLASGVVDGIKNHLWGAFKTAVQGWFNSKLEQVLGLGSMVWGLIKSGGLSLAKVGKMAWEGIKAMIPPTLIRILVEKLVALIVPAAGAVMIIVEGLQAAWGAVQRIIAAFQKFFTFLKAVKSGNAGPPFAQALAAAAIAVIDFVANWLIAKLARGAAKLGGKIKALAKKILGRKKGKAKGKRARAKRKTAKTPSSRKPSKKPGKKPGKKPAKPKKTSSDKKRDKQKSKEKKKRERLEKAKRELPPKIQPLLRRGVKGLRLKAKLLYWKVKYRLSSLRIVKTGKSFNIIAKVNPSDTIINGVTMDRDNLLKYMRDLAKELFKRKDVKADARKIQDSEGSRKTADANIKTATIPQGASIPARVLAGKEGLSPLGKGKHRELRYEKSDAKVRQAQSRFHAGSEHQEIKAVNLGGSLEKTKKYVDLGSDTAAMGADLAQAMRQFGRRGTVPEGMELSQVAALHNLMFVQESIRSPAAMFQAQMSLDLLAKGKRTPQDIFGRDHKEGGLFPMSAKGAQGRARAVDAQLEGKEAKASDEDIELQKEREIKLIKAWVESLDLVFDSKSTQKQKEDKIKQQIKTRMYNALGIK
jgi:hypothetical protein